MKAPKRALSVFAIGVALALAFFIVPAVTDSGQQASADAPFMLIYYDGHIHTWRSDGTGSVAQIKETALARGLKAVIITDHCKGLTPAEWQSLVDDTAEASDAEFLALPAFEITGSEGILNRGHMNAYNVSSPWVTDELCPEEVWPDYDPNPDGTGANAASLKRWAAWVHSKGGIVNHNHTSGSTQLSYDVNNIEIYNQGHVDDVSYYARLLGFSPQIAWQFGITLNNLAIYGERDLAMMVPFPMGDGLDNDHDGLVDEDPVDGIDNDGDGLKDEDWMSLKYGVYVATQMLPPPNPRIGQWLGAPQAPLNSWDQLLMAYVNGTVDKPTFAVANSDAHNTNHMDKDSDGHEGEDLIDGIDNDGDTLVDEDPPGGTALDSNVGLAKNGLYVKALTPDEVYKAIKSGRSFATTGPSLAFTVNGKMMGSTAYVLSGASANLSLSATAETPGYVVAKIVIYKNGQLWKTIPGGGPATRTDTVIADGYYRIEVTSVGPGLPQFAYSNPVFVDVP